jgi:acetyl-CoA C-acetyltransferase
MVPALSKGYRHMTKLRRAAIVSPVRTGVGKFQGALSGLQAGELGAIAIRALVERTKINPEKIDDVVFSQGYPSGEAPAIGRWSALAAGLPISVPGFQLDRRCGSGLQAVVEAAMFVQTGAADVVIAGGVESMMSQPVERFGVITGMIETAENLAKDYQIPREACDEYAARSQQRAAAAWAAGKFDNEIIPVTIPQKKGDPIVFRKDEGVRGDATAESLGQLRAIEKGGVVTAGNASQQNDAAAACIVVAEDKLEELGLEPIGYFTGWAAAGCEPSRMGIGPVPAVERLFARTGLSWKDIDLVELNEAFAPQVLAVLKGWNWNDADKLNVNGSGISLGHPIGATGIRILATMLNEMQRRNVRYGLETMCIGGGQGIAAVFERAA